MIVIFFIVSDNSFAKDLSEFRDDIYRYYVNHKVDGYEKYNTKTNKIISVS